MAELSLLPSVVVFGVTAVIVVAIVLAVKSQRRKAIAEGRIADPRGESLERLETRAGQSLVRTDEAVRRATEELGFAVAQFGAEATGEFDAALGSARSKLRDAFRLRQRLSDEVPDTDGERRSWSERIIELCDAASSELEKTTSTFDDRRAAEREAPERLRALQQRLEKVRNRLADAAETRAELDRQYAPEAFADQADAVATAKAQLLIADGEVGHAAAATDSSVPAVPSIEAAERAASAAGESIAALDRRAERLRQADDELTQLIGRARKNADEAARLRDSSELPEASRDIGEAVAALRVVLDAEDAHTGLRTPLAAIDRIRAADERLDDALASARSQQQRVDNAREALAGALFSAQSHLATARDVIEANRQRVGADARTRLAESERQLALAEAESDPIAALDIARRASRVAQDADALARYDLGPRTAPIARR